MPRPPSAESVLRKIKQNTPQFEPKVPIATDMFLPNHSGDHSAGIVRTTPTEDMDIVNKAYVDAHGGVTDHTLLTNIGTNTHAQIDTAITDSVNHISETIGNHLPAGTILMWGGAGTPGDFLPCDGASKLRASFTDLFNAIGTTFGSADGTHFNVPDFRGAFPRGAGTSTAFTQDHTTTLGTYENDAMQGHYHLTDFHGTSGAGYGVVDSGTAHSSGQFYSGSPSTDGTNGTPRTANETRPNNLGINFIIKY